MKTTIKIIIALLSLITSAAYAQEKDINPHVDTLQIARYPLTHPSVLDAITDSTIKKYSSENSQRILQSLILNPNSADKSLNKIAILLLKQPIAEEDVLLTLVSHKNISNYTLENISKLTKDRNDLNILYRFCELKLKTIEK